MEQLITTKKLHADLFAAAEAEHLSDNLSVSRIKLGMLFCRLARLEGWDFATEIEPVCVAAFESDRGARGDDVGLGTLNYLLRYCEGSAA